MIKELKENLERIQNVENGMILMDDDKLESCKSSVVMDTEDLIKKLYNFSKNMKKVALMQKEWGDYYSESFKACYEARQFVRWLEDEFNYKEEE